MRFNHLGKPMQLKGLAASQLIEQWSLNMFNKLETKEVVLQLMEEESTDRAISKFKLSKKVQQLLKDF